LLVLKIAARCVLSKEAVKIIRIQLSFKTINKRIEDMSDDIKLQMTQCFDDASKKWALQIDESTYISIKAQLLAFLRFVYDKKTGNNHFFAKNQKLKQQVKLFLNWLLKLSINIT
jgi:hypothetical protein